LLRRITEARERLNPVAARAISDPLFQGPVADHAAAEVLTVAEAIKKFETDPHRKKLSPKNRLGYLMPFRLLRDVAGADTPWCC
jgi:hypothetical protein